MGHPINGHDVITYGEDRTFDDIKVVGVGRVGSEVVFGVITTVKQVGESESGGSVLENGPTVRWRTW